MTTIHPPEPPRREAYPPPEAFAPREREQPREDLARARAYTWGVPMTIGILLTIGGIFAFAMAAWTSFISVIYIGVLLVVAGVLEIVSAIRHRHEHPFLVYGLTGVLAVIVGVMFLSRPLVGLAALTFLIAGYLFATGLFRGITAISERYPRWGWDFAYGVVAIALGVYIVASWPISALWVLGTVVSAEIIARGIALIAASSALRDIQHGKLRAPRVAYAPS